MRRNRRGGGSGLEFGGSGEDSFVAVVVTKLTGALLFILLLTMVIMALLAQGRGPGPPGARRPAGAGAASWPPLAIPTPEIASRGDRRPALRRRPGRDGRARATALDARAASCPKGLSI